MGAVGGVIVAREAKVVCSLSGLDQQIYRDKIVTLEGLRKGLQTSIGQANGSANAERAAQYAIVGCKILKAGIDVYMDVLASRLGPAGMAIGKLYEGASTVVDTINGDLDGGKAAQLAAANKFDVLSAAAKGAKQKGLEDAAGQAKTLMNLSLAAIDIAKTIKDGRGGDSGIRASMKTLNHQLILIDHKIEKLQAALAACE